MRSGGLTSCGSGSSSLKQPPKRPQRLRVWSVFIAIQLLQSKVSPARIRSRRASSALGCPLFFLFIVVPVRASPVPSVSSESLLVEFFLFSTENCRVPLVSTARAGAWWSTMINVSHFCRFAVYRAACARCREASMFEVSYLQFHQSVVKRPRAHIGRRDNKNARACPPACFCWLYLLHT